MYGMIVGETEGRGNLILIYQFSRNRYVYICIAVLSWDCLSAGKHLNKSK